jgi:hypothetical protein
VHQELVETANAELPRGQASLKLASHALARTADRVDERRCPENLGES